MDAQKMQENYRALALAMTGRTFRCNKRQLDFAQLGHFVAKRGEYYAKSTVRLLVIGRCTYGWPSLHQNGPDPVEAFARRAAEEYLRPGYEGYFSYSSQSGYTGVDYLFNRSPFWQAIHSIWQGLSHTEAEEWLDYIAWSNLYKVAPNRELPGDSGSPTQLMRDCQFSACLAILQQELLDLQPTHILFITGWEGWFAPFAAAFRAIHRPSQPFKFIEGAGSVPLEGRNIPALVVKSPQGKKKSAFVAEVVQYFTHKSSQLKG